MLMHVPAPSIACHSGFGLAEIGALSDDVRAGFTPWLPVLHLLGFVPTVATNIILALIPTIQVYREYFGLVSGLGFAPARLPVVHGGGAYTEHAPELRLRETSCVEACPSHYVPPCGRVVVHHLNPFEDALHDTTAVGAWNLTRLTSLKRRVQIHLFDTRTLL